MKETQEPDKSKFCEDEETKWIVQYEDSIVEPLRTVLDICCGEYAGGKRSRQN